MDIFKFITNEIASDYYEYHYYDGNNILKQHVFPHSTDQLAIYKFQYEKATVGKIQNLIASSFLEQPDYSIIFDNEGKISEAAFGLGEIHNKLAGEEEFFLVFYPACEACSMARFKELIAHLRSPEGCPWDREQTHLTLRTNLIEEAYEVLSAIDEGEPDHLREELGDLLLQIVLHAQIANENKEFNIDDVIQRINSKIVSRHPHVFGDVRVDGAVDAIKRWEEIKEKERALNGITSDHFQSILSSIPTALPSLSVAQKYQERASRVGFDWNKIEPVIEKIEEELDEVKDTKSSETSEEELGDLLFAVVNLVRWMGFDAESTLRKSNRKFLRRFEFVEKTLLKNGKALSTASLAEMDALWDLAKINEKKDT